ncbi:MAG TPA: OpgC domain-containing protein, partial [Candidatus Binataceae bacterium]
QSLFENPARAFFAAATIRYLPTYVDILPLYLIFLAAAPALVLLVKRNPALAIFVSALVYCTAWVTSFNLTSGDGRGWCFNPVAWQLLFTIGMVAGHLSRTRVPRRERLWLYLAAGFLVIAFVAAAPWKSSQAGLSIFNSPLHLWPAEKTFLSPLRIINVLALAYVCASLISPQSSIFRNPLATPFLACGRNALTIYWFGVVLSCAAYLVLTEHLGGFSSHAVTNITGILILFAIAGGLEWRRALRSSYGGIAAKRSVAPLRFSPIFGATAVAAGAGSPRSFDT